MGDVQTRELKVAELSVGLVLPAGLPAPSSVSIGFNAETRDELTAITDACGGIDHFNVDRSATMLSAHGGAVSVFIHLRGELAPPKLPVSSVVQDLIAAGAQHGG